ncbi:MAG TPA: TonB-dependent receptor plug domain-containing protein, partial [Thermoanaerobaculia bacterium]
MKLKWQLLTMAFAVLASASAFGQTEPNRTDRMGEDLIYSVNRVPERAFDTARSVEVVTSEELWRKNGLTLADVLADLPGVSVQQSTYYGGVPSIRGLNGKQVQILIDGVRLNNATWGGFETNVLNMIDVSMIERIEIVRGVVSVFGSESLGGVINIITRKSSS